MPPTSGVTHEIGSWKGLSSPVDGPATTPDSGSRRRTASRSVQASRSAHAPSADLEAQLRVMKRPTPGDRPRAHPEAIRRRPDTDRRCHSLLVRWVHAGGTSKPAALSFCVPDLGERTLLAWWLPLLRAARRALDEHVPSLIMPYEWELLGRFLRKGRADVWIYRHERRQGDQRGQGAGVPIRLGRGAMLAALALALGLPVFAAGGLVLCPNRRRRVQVARARPRHRASRPTR